MTRFASTVHAGTAYEEHVLAYLQRALTATVVRIGGSNDQGVDLRGHIDANHRSIDLIVQCKHYQTIVTPSVIRELQGTLYGFGANSQDQHFFGVLACSNGIRDGSLEALRASPLPMGVLVLAMDRKYATSLLLNRPARTILPTLQQRVVYEGSEKFIDIFLEP